MRGTWRQSPKEESLEPLEQNAHDTDARRKKLSRRLIERRSS
jgi:hypothetical protein